ncbi:DUF4229 domain-containing protein [Demequina sp.]|uniref:DUF4229 domain-containing protein n=1 Tax=Demequina sp. TaxID=2050685 RepID=UPI003D10172F
MRVLTYWLARLGIWAAIAALLWWVVKWQDLISLIASFVLAWLVSYLALPGMRRQAAAQMDGWMTRSEKHIHEADAEEDAEIGAFTRDDRES